MSGDFAMPTTVTSLTNKVLTILQKDPLSQGFYTPAKVLQFFNESVDYVMAQMAISETGEWLDAVAYIDTLAGGTSYAIPTGAIMIKTVRYLIGTIYIPLVYDEQHDGPFMAAASGIQQYPTTWRLIGDNIVFNPPLALGGTAFLQVEYIALPAELAQGGNVADNLNRFFQHFVEYRTASCCASSIGKFNKEWQEQSEEWKDILMRYVNKRVNSMASVKEFQA